MKKLIAPVLSMCVCVGSVLAGPPQPSKDPTDINAVTQVEEEMGDAMVRLDIDKLNQIYADDFKSFHDKLVSFENGPMDVQVFGNVAVVHGGTTEKRIRDGKDASGEFVWMDLLERRAGKWVVVRSAGSRVK
jgi:ketosteroid isomerase-like protein